MEPKSAKLAWLDSKIAGVAAAGDEKMMGGPLESFSEDMVDILDDSAVAFGLSIACRNVKFPFELDQ